MPVELHAAVFSVDSMVPSCAALIRQAAREAYRSFLLSYNSHQLKSIFNVHRLDLAAVSRSFGFSAPPKARI